MKKISELLTIFLLQSGEIDKEDCSVYKYGFTIMLEKGIFLLICLLIAIAVNKEIEMVLFFIIFIPLRSYAGGLHLEHFASCLLLSIMTYISVLIVSSIDIPIEISLIISICSLISISFLYPVENKNRKVDEEDIIYFFRKFRRLIIRNYILIIVFYFLGKSVLLTTVSITLMIISVTMGLGKIKNRYERNE